MRSFDFYETLITRMAGRPSDIFAIVGERLTIQGFAELRIQAEVRARKSLGAEVTFDQIYEYLALPVELKRQAQLLEIELERTLVRPITSVLSKMRSGDLIVSDMYHRADLYREILKKLAPDVMPGAVIVSGSVGLNKASGKLWKKVIAEYPDLQNHVGDNPLADVKRAQQNGLRASHYHWASLNRYEAALASNGLDGSLMAGVSKSTRLSLIGAESSPSAVATVEAFSSVFGPLLYAFADWIIRACENAGINNVYFLARDGQLPFEICQRLTVSLGSNLECHYIYASRQALHLPGCKSIDDAESWLLENTPHLSLRVVADRAGVPLECVVDAASPVLAVGPEANIPMIERPVLKRVIRNPAFLAAFNESIRRVYEPAFDYYRAQGLQAKDTFAIVDVGWNGRMQSSFRSLLEKSSLTPKRILGLYLCLSHRLSSGRGDELRGFIADPERPSSASFFDQYRHVFEAALSADHPTTLRFLYREGKSVPCFGAPYPAKTREKILLQHASVNAFIENLLTVSDALGRPIQPSTGSVVENLMRFLSRPTRMDGKAFEDFLFVDGQTGTEMSPVCKVVSPMELFKRSRNLGYWREGSMSLSGLDRLLPVRTAMGRLRKAFRPGNVGVLKSHNQS